MTLKMTATRTKYLVDTMTSFCWHAVLLFLLVGAIPCRGKITVSSSHAGIQVGTAKPEPKKKKTLSITPPFCDDETCKDDAKCIDMHADCTQRAKRGECDTNSDFMLLECKESCFVCGQIGDLDLGVAQTISPERSEDVKALLLESREYLKHTIDADPKLRSLLDTCKLKHEDCTFWAVSGECDKNPNYMNWNCGAVCQSCAELSYEKRCPIDSERTPKAWKSGDLNEMFANITTLSEYKQYEPTVLSRPDHVDGDAEETATYQIGPWVVVLDNVLSMHEANRLIELGAAKGYKPSYDVGQVKADGSYESRIHKGRTSTTAWCNGDCLKDDVAQAVMNRIANLTNIPQTNSEYLQLLKYEEGQSYVTHHDYIPEHKERQSGVRIMTVFLYLNDECEQGGGTNFPELNITVQPKLGRALLWPNVLNEDPDQRDDRTLHQAMAVKKGTKYGANAWIHSSDYKNPHISGCGSIVRHSK